MQPPSKIAASNGICISPSRFSMSATDRERRVEAALFEFAAKRDEAGKRQIGYPAARRGLAGNTVVVEQPCGRRAAGYREGKTDAGGFGSHVQGGTYSQVGQFAERLHPARRDSGSGIFNASGRRIHGRVENTQNPVGFLP